jgi:hypothetical protein
MLSPLVFLQYDFHWHWFLLCVHPQFCVWNSIRSCDLKNFLNAPVYTFQCGTHVVYHSTLENHLAAILHTPVIERPGPD